MSTPRFHHDPHGWAAWFWDLGFFRFGVARESAGDWPMIRGCTVPCSGPDAVAEELLRQRREAAVAYERLGTPMPPASLAAQRPIFEEDLPLLYKDPYRVAFAPEDADVYPSERRLARLLAEDLPRISRGAFLPLWATEAWSEDAQQVAAVFGRPPAQKRGAWLPRGGFDVRLARDVNALVPPGAALLYFVLGLGEEQPCLFLTPVEAGLLARKRGWRWHSDQGFSADGVPLRGQLTDWPWPGTP